MEKVSRKTTKLCSFYVSDWHLVTMLLPYLNEEINKENKIVTLLETNIKEKVETLVKKLNLKNSEQILNINWNIVRWMEQNKNVRNIKIINCYEITEFNYNITEILDEHDKILNTSGEREKEDVFEGYEKV